MFHMQSFFSLRQGVSLEVFKSALDLFVRHMQEQSLIVSVGPVRKRFSETPMDTDTERDHHYFFATTFLDQEQCDRSYAYIENSTGEARRIHRGVMEKVEEGAVFMCWSDME